MFGFAKRDVSRTSPKTARLHQSQLPQTTLAFLRTQQQQKLSIARRPATSTGKPSRAPCAMLATRMSAHLGRALPRRTAIALRPRNHVTIFRPNSTALVDDDDAIRRIYFHQGGNKTIFMAFTLSRISNPPPITIIVHEYDLFKKFVTSGKKLVYSIHITVMCC